jgi:ABC-type branched-subunit amino acid transport system ATPase component
VTDFVVSTDSRNESPSLRVANLVIKFGGVVAVDGISLDAMPSQVTGLIGPNGAGKTTTFNACCGMVRPSEGTICLFGEDVHHLTPSSRARLGLGRTFQRTELFDSLTVLENVALGREGSFGGAKPWKQLVSTRRERAEVIEAAEQAIQMCELERLTRQTVRSLSTGQRRLVEMARVIAGGFRVLLLDEPSSGLDRIETERFGDIVGQLVDQRKVAVLLVEHDMSLVMGVCDRIYVLDFGRMIFNGTPLEVRTSSAVRNAYLGSSAIEEVAGIA